jgi:hypothetical protein
MADLLHPDQTQEDEPTQETPSDPGEFVLAFQAEDRIQAQLLLSACDEAGIPAILESPRSGPVGTIASPVDGFNILVPQRDLARAQSLLQERSAALLADPDGAARAAEAEAVPTAVPPA